MNNTTKKGKTPPTMEGEGLPQNPGQAMFPTDLSEGLIELHGQIHLKRNEGITVKLMLDPLPTSYQVTEDDLLMTVANWMTNEGFHYLDLEYMIAKIGLKGHYFTIAVPAEVAQAAAPLSHFSPYSPWHSR